MTKQEQTYQKVEAYKKAHPDQPLESIFKKLKVHGQAYYKHKRIIAATKKVASKTKAKRKYTRQVVATAPTVTPSQVTVIMGTPDQIRAVLQ